VSLLVLRGGFRVWKTPSTPLKRIVFVQQFDFFEMGLGLCAVMAVCLSLW